MEAAQLMRPLIDKVSSTPELDMMAKVFLAAHLDAEAEMVLQKYLRAEPQSNADMWIELAKIQHRTGRVSAAQQSFGMAYRIDANGVFAKLQKDQELMDIAAPLFRRKK